MLKLIALLILAGSVFGEVDDHVTLPLGSLAPDFSLPGVDGKVHTLGEFSGSRILVIVFTSNHCPTAQLYEDRIKKLASDYRDRGVVLVAINSNDPRAVHLDELGYTDVGDGFEDMKIRARYRHFNFPYLYDGETESVSEAYGPKATPHVFVFDEHRKLRYEGRVDNSVRESLVNTSDTRNAIEALLGGKPAPVEHTGVFGCSIKWQAKRPGKVAEWKKIEQEPVRLEPAGSEELQNLRRNPTGKVLLVNFWATSCGTCLSELADLETTYRMYRRRDFDLVTVATNPPDDAPAVLEALQQQHASSRNLQFASRDRSAMEAAFGAKWEPGAPFTIAFAPDGHVVYEKRGEVDILEMRRTLLANIPDLDYIGHRAYWATK